MKVLFFCLLEGCNLLDVFTSSVYWLGGLSFFIYFLLCSFFGRGPPSTSPMAGTKSSEPIFAAWLTPSLHCEEHEMELEHVCFLHQRQTSRNHQDAQEVDI